MNKMAEKILDVRDLSIDIRHDQNTYAVVEGISFHLNKGEILGIVGESGCGKTVTVMTMVGLEPEMIVPSGGTAMFHGIDLLHCSEAQRQEINGKDISVIYQEPMTSLNPLQKVGRQIGESLRLHTDLDEKEIRKRVIRMLKAVELRDPEKTADSYPHQLSGGMRQRVMMAMAGICHPQILVCDEPTTALDVTTQAEILELLREWNRKQGTSVIFISHDLAVINRICDRVMVMYAGKIAEIGKTEEILQTPAHPYTQGLLASIPTMGQKGRELHCIPGRVPAVTEKRESCPFAPRCTRAGEDCRHGQIPAVRLSDTHEVHCRHISGKETGL